MPLAVAPARTPASPTRAFGSFALLRLLGKSDATMAWLAVDTRTSLETMLTMPRVPPIGTAALGNWLLTARRAARLDHPHLATVAECGVHERWPFVAVNRGTGLSLEEWLIQQPRPPIEDAALWIAGVLRGLAYAHDAGIAHLDLQPHNVVVNERGQASVMALAVAAGDAAIDTPTRRDTDSPPAAFEPSGMRWQRAAAERDVLACGVLLHRLLAGAPALGDDDVARVIERLPPRGREGVRLPWTPPQPIPEGLRAIVNRSTTGQPRLRYRNARTFHNALDGWLAATAEQNGGPVALLLDRLQSVGHFPALPGLAARVCGVTRIESQRTDEIARYLLPDMALSFELLRTLNTARVQGTQIPGNGPVLTLRRVVALIGVDGVREAANSLRSWPGPLDESGAEALRAVIDSVRLAGHTAQALRPAGYDGEVVYLVAVLQNLGRLLLNYHFADEAEQMRQLMRPADVASGCGEPAHGEHAGLGEEAAAFAVLGVDIETLGIAAARHWGLGDDVLHMIRRLPGDVPVRNPDGDTDLLRIVASAANEAVDALALLPSPRVATALAHVGQRYARTLRLTARTLHDALHDAKDMLRNGGTGSMVGRGQLDHAAGSSPEGDDGLETPAANGLPIKDGDEPDPLT